MNQITCATAPIVAVFESASSIRIILIDGEPWFSAADVCNALGYANSRKSLADHCRAGGVTKRDTPTNSGVQAMTYISEGNLYRLAIKSHKPEAEKFEAWVCDDVLPSIRKTGYYVAPIPERAPEPERGITLDELNDLKRAAHGVARYFAVTSETQALYAIYSRIKAPLRIGRLDALPASRLADSMAWLKDLEEKARGHWRAMQAYEVKVMQSLGVPLVSG